MGFELASAAHALVTRPDVLATNLDGCPVPIGSAIQRGFEVDFQKRFFSDEHCTHGPLADVRLQKFAPPPAAIAKVATGH